MALQMFFGLVTVLISSKGIIFGTFYEREILSCRLYLGVPLHGQINVQFRVSDGFFLSNSKTKLLI